MTRSTLIQDLNEEFEEIVDTPSPSPSPPSPPSPSLQLSSDSIQTSEYAIFKDYFMEHLKDIILVILIVLFTNQSQLTKLINNLPVVPKNEYSVLITKSILGGVIYFTSKYFLN